MEVLFTTRFERSYKDAPATIKRAFDKQLVYLLQNLRHPSLRAKKYDNERWQARITRDWRFYFRIEDNTYILLDMMPHPK
jgi:mRNA-degrading endonuclease RelE of RelBE toxin-antitoxin system